MGVLGLRFFARAFSSCGKWGPLFIAVRRPLIIEASLVAEHRLQTRRLSNCGSRAYLLRGIWDLPRPGLEPVSPALAGRFSTTVPPGKPGSLYFCFHLPPWKFLNFLFDFFSYPLVQYHVVRPPCVCVFCRFFLFVFLILQLISSLIVLWSENFI